MRVRDLTHPSEPRLAVLGVGSEELVLGAFQRAASALRPDAVAARGLLVTRRASGGPALLAGPGSLHLALSLPRHDALVACAPSQIVNRYVRPLLGGLARLGAKAHYFGRDWVSAAHRPVAWIGFAHGAGGRTLVEAIVAVSHPFALPAELEGYPARAADPFLGKAPATLEEVVGARLDLDEAASAIAAAYHAAYGPIAAGAWTGADLRPPAADDRPPWDALVEEAIGFVGAARAPADAPALDVGGDLLASEEVIEALGRLGALAAAPPAELDEAVRAAARRGVIEGVRDLRSIARVVVAAGSVS